MKLLYAVAFAACLFISAPLYAEDTYPFPPIPKTQVTENMHDLAEFKRLSDGGDGVATFYLAEQVHCKQDDVPCINSVRELLKKAIAQGETPAVVSERLLALRLDPSLAATYQSATSVCGNTIETSDALIKAITAINSPDKQSPTSENWQIGRGKGSLGSTLFALSNRGTGIAVVLIFHDGNLKIVRVFTNLLVQGDEKLVNQINKQVATDICPRWQGLDRAWENYLPGVFAWPPRGVHVNGPRAWFSMTAVIPDIMWYELYVDPFHNPFTSGIEERFAPETAPANPSGPSQ